MLKYRYLRLVAFTRRLVKRQSCLFFRVEEIDTYSNIVTISCRGKQTSIRSPLPQVVYTPFIINGLSPQHACWLGYYYGQQVKRNTATTQPHIKTGYLQLKTGKGNMILQSQARDGQLYFQHRFNHNMGKASALDLANNPLINEFDPTQACYIGILAGMESFKQKQEHTRVKQQQRPNLRLVKSSSLISTI